MGNSKQIRNALIFLEADDDSRLYLEKIAEIAETDSFGFRHEDGLVRFLSKTKIQPLFISVSFHGQTSTPSELIKKIRAARSGTPIVLLSGVDDIKTRANLWGPTIT